MEVFDYHVHSNNSFDGKDNLIDICISSIKMGLTEICFTEHFSVNPNDPSYNFLDYDKYSKEIEECNRLYGKSISVKKGVEVGEPHIKINILKEYFNDKQFDFVIGSVHNIGDLKLRKYMDGKDKNQVYRDYFEEFYNMVKFGDMDVLGHLDLMKRYAFGQYGDYDFKSHEKCIVDILKKAIDRGIGIEINTSGLRGNVNQAFPSIDILKAYKDLGGEIITIGSDSHCSSLVGNNFDTVIEMLRALGFKYIFKFKSRKSYGIKIS